ncbi:hypothetical protein Dtox_3296 [Desulfofarcimen acetoxidans DSM 771]|uniref:Uncharacterized protein n=1 Tax=Desulfofarcimen acetoxidans (strain ATCC 49208 / DSM 771 / KCTC 5769 / VKM B-1644 / 5575) TaxID=485916 RepID=C8W5M8_DESAS|nr:hypothetical protein [Desulfofarcimen acetoxidans]ACV64028.1 hypothetical protein Dtox_3296 [Desulfofarcimen acetoxidans DSM 771]
MNYLPTMTEDEIRYICSVIPLQDSVGYFKYYPKDFAKVMPGFRATSLKSQEQVSGILFRNRNQHFISSFIEKHISRWLDEIGAAINEKTEEGESKESALLQTLPHCFFVDNIGLYFKLTGEEYTGEFLSMLSASIRFIKDANTECERTKSKLDTKTTEVSRLEAELERVQTEQSKMSQKLSERLDEIKTLKRTNADLEKSKGVIASHEQTIGSLKQKAQEREDYIQQLKAALSVARKEQQQLEKKIRVEIAKQQETEKYRQDTAQKPKCPKDLDEFRDYLGYNFENIGVPANSDYYPLLKDYLSEILFQGKPIIISRSTGLSLMKCVSNTLVKTSVVTTLAFDDDVTEKLIDGFLSQDKRIVCLDNFIGNYNETTLITICDRHRDKIIFLTIAYDHTLCFVPDELMRYCHYLNLNRVEAFTGDTELTEDPSVVDEVEKVVTSIVPDVRWTVALKEMLEEFGVQGALSAYKSSLVADELSFCRLLAFDVLPYCTDVLKIAPFNVSERLVKYAGDSGRCLYKNLFRRWFA